MDGQYTFFHLFTDPLFRGPMLGSILMSFSTALVGAITFIRKKSLVGETLSHATFPGVVLGVFIGGVLFSDSDLMNFICVLIGACASSLLAQYCIEKMIKKQVKVDAILCYILAAFLGLGVLIASGLQYSHPIWYRKVQLFFYGQAATMTDLHVYIYAALSLCIALVIIIFNRAFKLVCFDPTFSETIGIKRSVMTQLFSVLLILAIVIGIRSVGVVLITGMLIAPAVAATVLTKRFSHFLIVSTCIAVMSAIFGNYFTTLGSVEKMHQHLPAGPTTVMIASFLALIALVMAPQKGLFIKMIRRWQFQKSCILENLLKKFWRQEGNRVSFRQITEWKVADTVILYRALRNLTRQGFLKRENTHYTLTEDGRKKASYIVRLHRLWELYLAQHLGNDLEHLHHSAEEMEHVITPDIEEKLTALLLNPTKDPHEQPIPNKELL
jgi:manganese/zinc/iron transport system permease protein